MLVLQAYVHTHGCSRVWCTLESPAWLVLRSGIARPSKNRFTEVYHSERFEIAGSLRSPKRTHLTSRSVHLRQERITICLAFFRACKTCNNPIPARTAPARKRSAISPSGDGKSAFISPCGQRWQCPQSQPFLQPASFQYLSPKKENQAQSNIFPNFVKVNCQEAGQAQGLHRCSAWSTEP